MSDVVFGIHACKNFLLNRPDEILQIYLQDASSKRIDEIKKIASVHHLPVQVATKKTLDNKSSQQNHQGVLFEVRAFQCLSEQALKQNAQPLIEQKTHPLIVVLDGVQDPHNVGAIIRTSEAFGVNGLILPKANSCGVTATVRKVASGAEMSLPIYQVSNLSRCLEHLQATGFWVIGTVMNSQQSLYQYDFKRPTILVMGNEQKGLRDLTTKHCDELVTIPLVGQTASLNVSVAAGICISELNRARHS